MRRTSLFGMAAMTALTMLFTACSNDVENTSGDAPTGSESRIQFTPVTDNVTGTRATATTTANYEDQIKNFSVWGYLTATGEYYLGTADNGVIIDNIENSSVHTWDYHSVEDIRYWPTNTTDKLNFYALTPVPTSDNGMTLTDNSLACLIPTDNTKQIDVMTAYKDNMDFSTNSGSVPLQFGHVLSQVLFKAKTSTSAISAEIKSITVHNVCDRVTLDIKDASATASIPTDAEYKNYSVGLANPVIANSTTTAVDATDADGVLLLAPQTLTRWANRTGETSKYTTTTVADDNNQSYLEIECKIKSGSTYLLGSDTDYGKAYVPFGQTWVSGNRYVYTLIFGVGWDSNGDQISTPIIFTVDVADWSDSSSDINL